MSALPEPGWRPDGSGLFHVGQGSVLDLVLQIPNPAGTGPFVADDPSGRVFIQRLVGRKGAVLVEAGGVLTMSGDLPVVRFAISGAQQQALLPAGTLSLDLSHVVYELVADSKVLLIGASYALRVIDDPGAPTPEPSDLGPPIGQFILQRSGQANGRVIVRQVGSPGPPGDLTPPALAALDAAEAAAGGAVVARQLAEGAGQLAVAKAAEATAAAAAALISKLAAEAAAAAAALTNLFPDEASGLAATAEGGYFAVVGVGETYASLYRKVAGAAELQNSFPSRTALENALDAIDAQRVLAEAAALYADVAALVRANEIRANYVQDGGLEDPTAAWGVRINGFLALTLMLSGHLRSAGTALFGEGLLWQRWRDARVVYDVVASVNGQLHTLIDFTKENGVVAGDFVPSQRFLSRIGGGLAVPAGLFAVPAAAAPTLQRIRAAPEGFPDLYVVRSDKPDRLAAPAMRLAWRLCITYSQSNGLGGGATDFPSGSRAVTTAAVSPHRAFMLTGSADGGPALDSLGLLSFAGAGDLVPLRESAARETTISAGVRWLLVREAAAGGEPVNTIGGAGGYAGQKLAELAEGTNPFANLLAMVAAMIQRAQDYGAEVVFIDAVIMHQGEADRSSTPPDTWTVQIGAFWLTAEAVIRSLLRQKRPIVLALRALIAPPGGIATAWTALGQAKAARTLPHVAVIYSDYFFQGAYGLSGVHRTPLGHALAGEYDRRGERLIARAMDALDAEGADLEGVVGTDLGVCLCWDTAAATRAGAVTRVPLRLPQDATTVEIDTTSLPAATNPAAPAGPVVLGVFQSGGGGVVTAVNLVDLGGGAWAMDITSSVAGAAEFTVADAVVDPTTTDRSSAWTNFRCPSADVSDAVPGHAMHHWLIPDRVSVD